MILAYISHDPDKDFDLAAISLQKARVTLAKIQHDYITRRKRIIDRFKPDLTGISGSHGGASKTVIELKSRLGLPIEDEDKLVIDELDRLAEDSPHAEETGAVAGPILRTPSAPELREVPRKPTLAS